MGLRAVEAWRTASCRSKSESEVTRSSASLASLDSMDIEGLDTITEEPPALVYVKDCLPERFDPNPSSQA